MKKILFYLIALPIGLVYSGEMLIAASAIAAGSDGSWGVSYNCQTKAEAEERALASCRKSCSDCTIKISGKGSGYGAIASSFWSGNYGYAVGYDTQAEAENAAIKACGGGNVDKTWYDSVAGEEGTVITTESDCSYYWTQYKYNIQWFIDFIKSQENAWSGYYERDYRTAYGALDGIDPNNPCTWGEALERLKAVRQGCYSIDGNSERDQIRRLTEELLEKAKEKCGCNR